MTGSATESKELAASLSRARSSSSPPLRPRPIGGGEGKEKERGGVSVGHPPPLPAGTCHATGGYPPTRDTARDTGIPTRDTARAGVREDPAAAGRTLGGGRASPLLGAGEHTSPPLGALRIGPLLGALRTPSPLPGAGLKPEP